jgi:signal transduction histidine kinase/ActR/RegA family two-component response regulator
MTKPDPESTDERVLILAPTGRDASLTVKYLAEAGVRVEPCAGIEELCEKLLAGGGAALVSEEALTSETVECLLEALGQQPAWSDFPLVILTTGEGAIPSRLGTLKALGEVGNMTLVERPTRVITLISALRSALRARHRQYQVREHLAAEERAQEERARLLEEAVVAREQAEEANRAKDLFLATLSHELRTPLTAVLGWARILRSMEMDDVTARHGLQVIERNAESQNQLIQDLLDVSRIISGKLRLDVKQVGLIPVIEAAVDSVQQAVEARNIDLDVEFGTGSDLVRGDPDRLQQVVWNLLSNAIKFTPKGGRVGVRLERHGSDVRIEVSDTGQGIAPEFLPHVFERFRQADGSTTRTHGGLGLGLAVVRHLVEQHGGTVSAESAGEQQGSTFTVDLPVTAVGTPDLEAHGETPHAAPHLPQEGSGLLCGVRILVVDDHTDARELLSIVLISAGAEVSSADSARAALAALQRTRPDVLISDIGMPGEDGFALINSIRSLPQEEGGKTPMIALTAYATEDDRLRALAAGFEDHLPKPVEPATLVTAVAHLVGRQGGENSRQ